jgi:hypothetical protein
MARSCGDCIILVRHGFLIILAVDTPNSIGWVGVAGAAPITEFCYINSTISRLTVEDPGLGALERFSDLPLCEAGLFAQFPEEGGDVGVTPFVLRFGQHGCLNSGG